MCYDVDAEREEMDKSLIRPSFQPEMMSDRTRNFGFGILSKICTFSPTCQ